MYGRRSKGGGGDDGAKSRGALSGCALWQWGEDGSEGGRCDRLIAVVIRRDELIVIWIGGMLKGDCREDFLLVLPRAVRGVVRRTRRLAEKSTSGRGGR